MAPARLIVYRLVPVATARPKVHFHSMHKPSAFWFAAPWPKSSVERSKSITEKIVLNAVIRLALSMIHLQSFPLHVFFGRSDGWPPGAGFRFLLTAACEERIPLLHFVGVLCGEGAPPSVFEGGDFGVECRRD